MRSLSLASLVFTGLGLVAACAADDSPSERDNDTTASNTNGNTDGNSSGDTQTTNGTTNGGGGSSAETTNGSANNNSGTAGSGATGGPSTLNQWVAADVAQVPHGQGVYSYGDGTSTMLLTSPAAGQICMSGTAADAGPDYALWGAGIGLQLAATEDEGKTVTSAFDAEALGITQFSFSITGVPLTGIRVGMTIVGEGADYEENPFINKGGAGGDVKSDSTYTMALADLAQPEWGLADAVFDPSSLHSLQFQVVTVPNAATEYDFCVSDIQFLDADGAVVEGPTVPPMPEGDAGASL